MADEQLAFQLYPDESGAAPAAPRIATPRDHGSFLHADGMGSISIAHRDADGRWREQAYPVEVAVELLNHHRGREDTYLSSQRFRGRRRIARLLSMGALFQDLDYYKIPGLADADPRRVLDLALGALSAAGMPEPSLAVSSGRGLCLFWIHSPIPRAALPRWTACQRELREVLRPFGGDPQALDAARVLRVVGTRHREAGVLVEAITPAGSVRPFDELAREILPIDRRELRSLSVHRALSRARSPQERLWTPPEGFTASTLWEVRLGDVQALRELRWFGEPLPDFRDRWLFVAGVAMSWLCPPAVLRRELYALAREAGGWTEARAKSKLQSVFRTAHEAAAGKRVEWEGLNYDPRYRMRNQTIIDALEITAEEERRLKSIISDDERRRRDRERKSPEMSRREYESRAANRRAQARKMASEGLSVRKIAAAMGISKSQVQRAISGAES